MRDSRISGTLATCQTSPMAPKHLSSAACPSPMHFDQRRRGASVNVLVLPAARRKLARLGSCEKPLVIIIRVKHCRSIIAVLSCQMNSQALRGGTGGLGFEIGQSVVTPPEKNAAGFSTRIPLARRQHQPRRLQETLSLRIHPVMCLATTVHDAPAEALSAHHPR